MKFLKIITTKYIGPTNNRGSRVKAIDSVGNSITIQWRSELGIEENHRSAATALLKKIRDLRQDEETNSHMVIVGYGDLNGKGYCFACERKTFTKVSK